MSSKVIPRWSTDREHGDYDWLKTFHTFSPNSNDKHVTFGSLRIINEDRVAAGTGFGFHPHSSFEIFSYVVSGELHHQDSMGNSEILRRGDIQLTSTGTGIQHSENAHGDKEVHFIQIWAFPTYGKNPPRYFTRHFKDEEKMDKWLRVVAPIGSEGVILDHEAEGPAPIQSSLILFTTILSTSASLSYTFSVESEFAVPHDGPRRAYIHIIQTSGYNPQSALGATVDIITPSGEIVLREGDGAYVNAKPDEALNFRNIGDLSAEILLFIV